MEAHLVHFNERYGNLETAINNSDGLAVVAFFIQASGHQDCQEFKQITEKLTEIQQPNSKCNLNSSRPSLHLWNGIIFFSFHNMVFQIACRGWCFKSWRSIIIHILVHWQHIRIVNVFVGSFIEHRFTFLCNRFGRVLVENILIWLKWNFKMNS